MLTGFWGSKQNWFEAAVANYLDGRLPGIVQDVSRKTVTKTSKGILTEEVDVLTKALKIEVKEGTSVKGRQLENLIQSAAKEGKKPVLFAPELNPKTGPSLERQNPGLKVFADWKKFGDYVIDSEKPKN